MFDAPKLKTTRGPPDARCAWAISFITSVRLTAAETVIEKSDAACGDQANAAAKAMVRSTATVYCRRSLGSPVFGLQSRAAVARKQVECEGLAPDCRRQTPDDDHQTEPKTEDDVSLPHGHADLCGVVASMPVARLHEHD